MNQLVKGRYLIGISIIIILVTCTKEQIFSPSILECEDLSDVIFPLCVDNTWDYEVTRYGADEEYYQNGYPQDPETMDVKRGVSYWTDQNSFQGFQVNQLIVDPHFFETPYLRNKADGLYTAIREGFIETESLTIRKAIPYPTFVGETLDYMDIILTTISDSIDVTVPAGLFQCIQYDALRDSSLIGQMWLAPNIGIIKSWQLNINNFRIGHELSDYEISD